MAVGRKEREPGRDWMVAAYRFSVVRFIGNRSFPRTFTLAPGLRSAGSCPEEISASTRMGRFEPDSRIEKSAYPTGVPSREYFRWRSTGILQMVPVTEPLNVLGRAGVVLSRHLSSPGDRLGAPAGTTDAARIQPRQSRTRNQASFTRQELTEGPRGRNRDGFSGVQYQSVTATAPSAGAANHGEVAIPRLKLLFPS